MNEYEAGKDLTISHEGFTEKLSVIKNQSKLLSLYQRKASIADELAGFYGDIFNWLVSDVRDPFFRDRIDQDDVEDIGANNYAGKLARQKQIELIEIDKQIREMEK